MEVGFREFQEVDTKCGLLKIATTIGEVIAHPNGDKVACVRPSTGEHSVKGTFSNRHGLSEFPLHTDTAFWSIPARYVVMGMIKKSDCLTSLVEWEEIFSGLTLKSKQYASTATYMIDNIEGKKYCSLLFNHKGTKGFRFDPSCMKPVNNAAKYFHSEFCEALHSAEKKMISWSGRKAVIIDNWKYLHGRNSVLRTDKERELFRVYVG